MDQREPKEPEVNSQFESCRRNMNINKRITSRSVVDFKTGDTPLHLACAGNCLEAVILMAEEEVLLTVGGGIPVYNQRNKGGKSPAFLTHSSEILQVLLQFDDLHVENSSGTTLLWKCAERGIVTDEIMQHQSLIEALGVRCFSRLPIEEGDVL